jgi:two-component system sensor histidine kinase RpfC
MMELLSLTELDAEQSSLAQAGVRSGHLIRALLTDVMDFSRRGLGQFELRPEPFDPRELTHTVCQMLQPADAAMGVTFTCEVAPEVPGTLVGSPVRIAQIISNLASNALKFTPQGTVRVLVAMEPDAKHPGHTGRLSITVADTGIGIPASQLRRIFEPFHQAHPTLTAQGFGTAQGAESSRQREAGNRNGVGLGLSITRNLVEAMNGSISVESSEGQGSRFHVSIPVVIPAKADSHSRVVSHPAVDAPSNRAVERTGAISLTGGYGPVAGITDEAPMRALVAEDNPVNRLLLDRQLQKLGCHVVTCESAEDAIEVWNSFRPHLVFTDHHMPGMSGLEFARTIRKREQALVTERTEKPFPRPAPDTRIILVTGSCPEILSARQLPTGIDGLLPKPFAMRELAALLAQERIALAERGAGNRSEATNGTVSGHSANDSFALTA